MRKYILLLTLVLMVSSCSYTNKIIVSSDPFKNITTIKLNQSLNGYSDEIRRGLFNFPDYYISFKHYFSMDSGLENKLLMDIKFSTPVRAYEVEPTLYLSMDGRKNKIEAQENILKMYQQGGSTTTSETSTSISEDPDNDGEEKTETTTTYSTSSSHNTYQLMQMRFHPKPELLQEISTAKKIFFRLYIDNEIIDIPLKRRDKSKYQKYIESISEYL